MFFLKYYLLSIIVIRLFYLENVHFEYLYVFINLILINFRNCNSIYRSACNIFVYFSGKSHFKNLSTFCEVGYTLIPQVINLQYKYTCMFVYILMVYLYCKGI